MNWNYSKTAVAGIIVSRGIRIDMANLSPQNPPVAITSELIWPTAVLLKPLWQESLSAEE